MNLPGRLRSTTLGDLLGALYRDRASGVLELLEDRGVGAGRSHRLYVHGGLVEEVDTPIRAEKLGELLKHQGFLGDDGYRWLRRRLTEVPSERAGALLVRAGIVSREAIGAVLRHQLRTRLEALFGVADAIVRFHVPRPRLVEPDRPLPLSPREFLHGRPRYRDRGCPRPESRPPSAATGHSAPRNPGGRNDPLRTRALVVLGLGPEADRGAVQQAFRRLAANVHPDRHPRATPREKAELIRRFAELSAAYHSLVA
jgi:hypothetical protein